MQFIKESGRILLIGLVTYLLSEGVVMLLVSQWGVFVNHPTQLVIVGLITAELKALDRHLHEKGASEGKPSMEKGLVRF